MVFASSSRLLASFAPAFSALRTPSSSIPSSSLTSVFSARTATRHFSSSQTFQASPRTKHLSQHGNGGKLKSHSGTKKRWSPLGSGSGKAYQLTFKRGIAGKSHLNSHMARDRLNNLGGTAIKPHTPDYPSGNDLSKSYHTTNPRSPPRLRLHCARPHFELQRPFKSISRDYASLPIPNILVYVHVCRSTPHRVDKDTHVPHRCGSQQRLATIKVHSNGDIRHSNEPSSLYTASHVLDPPPHKSRHDDISMILRGYSKIGIRSGQLYSRGLVRLMSSTSRSEAQPIDAANIANRV
ncbi:hypothetical protein PHSY_003014 [Pseudozyma hubeiensis SY62]|uniref:Uncharacterized protein n=1 Tax=Pseudozyma hubeiensis (strain SY62) TaxID=1305764 RepID=R9P254_PSEHS|nr:hypothetical protein PHSY_003014 [Pseudozyma hubeiensis SY62]GAC95438.1 hypothetical protein PHSY_003014 [Pseudozyma hubeiensis SY62]